MESKVAQAVALKQFEDDLFEKLKAVQLAHMEINQKMQERVQENDTF